MQIPKMYNLYTRNLDDRSRCNFGEYFSDIIDALAGLEWQATEKLHGMNMRVVLEDGVMRFAGKSDRAQLPGDLVEWMTERFDAEKILEAFDHAPRITLYGEGVGPGIQKGGEAYSDEKIFVGFDINVGGTWLDQASVREHFADFDVPFLWPVDYGTLPDLAGRVAEMRTSEFALLSTGSLAISEGVVARPPVELRDPWGNRIIVKIKSRDLRPADHDGSGILC